MTKADNIFKGAARPLEATHNWERFLEGVKKKKKGSLDPFMGLFGNSRFLSHFLIRHPETVNRLHGSPYFTQEKKEKNYMADLSLLMSEKSSAALLEKIREYKYREYCRITIKALSNISEILILNELSGLALALLTTVDDIILKESVKKWGAPRLANGSPSPHQILALGKLGGYELNYSSDIDLLAFIESDDGNAGSLSLHEFFVRHVRNLTETLQTKTGEGFLYRVDWDLRPEGKAGTLVNSLAALEHYYETFGRDWERQALIKAKPAAGDKKLGETFLAMIRPFVFRKYLDVENIRRVHEMKQKIHADLDKKRQAGFNVKLGVGGIREIEFFAQAFLLLFGGQNPSLCHTNTLETLKRLEKARLITRSDAGRLHEAYLFLRKVENRLQMVDEAQTHLVPDNPEEQVKIARLMGYDSDSPEKILEEFLRDLNHHRNHVARLFENLFADPGPSSHSGSPLLPSEADEKESGDRTLKERLSQRETFEEKLDEIRIFKKEAVQAIRELETKKGASRKEIFHQLSSVAQTVSRVSLDFARSQLEPIYGCPTYTKTATLTDPAHLIAMGMGKLGGMEINYSSDLDLIFIYSENGETSGPRVVVNQEYFARLVQKFITILSVHTRQGFAYAIDTELRPSGHQGLLVTSLESFMDYQRKVSQIWERQSLLRARTIAGPPSFGRLVENTIRALLFSGPFPKKIRDEMHPLRMRVEFELARETDEHFDFKGGCGGVMDIEYILQFLQLRYGYQHPLLQTANTFEGLNALIALNLLPQPMDGVILKEAYTFYRTLETKLFLRTGRGLHRASFKNPLLKEIARDLEIETVSGFVEQYRAYRDKVREIYRKIFLE